MIGGIGVLLVLGAAVAADGFDVDVAFAAARRAEQDGRYAEAVEACGEIVRVAPTSGRASTCARRIGFLERRRDRDGSFAAWAALQGVRAQLHGSGQGDALAERVAAIAADPDASRVVRAEAAVWLGQRALDADDPDRAVRVTAGVAERGGLDDDPAVSRQLLELHAVALATAGRDEEALAAEGAVRIPAEGAARPTPVEGVIAERRRRAASAASVGAVVVFVAVAGGVVALRSGPRLAVPAGLVPIGLAVGGAGALAAGWELGAAAWAPVMGAGFAGVHLLALAAIPRVTGPLRIAVRALAAAATLAVGWLALAWTGTTAWIGL